MSLGESFCKFSSILSSQLVMITIAWEQCVIPVCTSMCVDCLLNRDAFEPHSKFKRIFLSARVVVRAYVHLFYVVNRYINMHFKCRMLLCVSSDIFDKRRL